MSLYILSSKIVASSPVDGDFLFFEVEPLGVISISDRCNKFLQIVEFYDSLKPCMYGFIIPQQMAIYILNLVFMKDLYDIYSAFGDILDKLILYRYSPSITYKMHGSFKPRMVVWE